MNTVLRATRNRALTVLSLLALTIALPVTGQDAKPQETHGVSVGASSVLPVEAQMPRLKGYALRIRQILLAPGAVVGHHSHARRPVVAYLVSGQYTEHRDGQATIVHQPGEQWVEGADVAHWSENRGSEPVVLINVDILPVQ